MIFQSLQLFYEPLNESPKSIIDDVAHQRTDVMSSLEALFGLLEFR